MILMQKLSALICSRNDIDMLLGLIDNLQGVADEIVVMDASKASEARRLVKMKDQLRKKKVRPFFTVATMYSDVMREYGRRKCTGDWMIFIDTDERLNDALKRDLKKIIKDTDCNGFWFARHEYLKSGSRPTAVTSTLRLHRREKARYRGDPHDLPSVSGKVCSLGPEYHLDHFTARFKTKEFLAKDMARAMKMEMNTRRQGYHMILDRLKGKPALHGAASIYFKLKRVRDQDTELTRFDYWLVTLMNSFSWFPQIVRMQGIGSYIDIFTSSREYEAQKTRHMFAVPERERRMQFLVSSDIYWAGGMTKYLGLADERKLKMWNRKYASVKNERPVLLDMLEFEYNSRHHQKIYLTASAK